MPKTRAQAAAEKVEKPYVHEHRANLTLVNHARCNGRIAGDDVWSPQTSEGATLFESTSPDTVADSSGSERPFEDDEDSDGGAPNPYSTFRSTPSLVVTLKWRRLKTKIITLKLRKSKADKSSSGATHDTRTPSLQKDVYRKRSKRQAVREEVIDGQTFKIKEEDDDDYASETGRRGNVVRKSNVSRKVRSRVLKVALISITQDW